MIRNTLFKTIYLTCFLLVTTIVSATEGALPGAFSVSATKKVYFSKGNLQYQASPKTWRFAEHQYDIIGGNNRGIGTPGWWVDLFGWSTDFTNYGVSTSTDDLSYKGSFVDWGNNKISNGGNVANQWHTLSIAEWMYILESRTNASSLYFRATVNDQRGVILLPDTWEKGTFNYTTGVKDFTTNSYTVSQWKLLESAGAVFLPCAGSREKYAVIHIGENGYAWVGYYWSSTEWGTSGARLISFSAPQDRIDGFWGRHWGLSVRLVTTTPPPAAFTITFNANGGLIPTNGNMGNTPAGHTTTLSADRKTGTIVVTAGTSAFWSMKDDNPTRDGYAFDGWWTAATGGTQVYDATGACIRGTVYWDANAKWIGTANLTLYAHWTPISYTITTSATNGTVTGGGTYEYNSTATLTASPADCYRFVRWSDGNTSNPRTVTVTGDATYTAIFEKVQYTVTTAPDDAEHGSTEAAEL